MKATFKGVIRLSDDMAFSFAVYAATEPESEDIRGHRMCPKCKSRINQTLTCSGCKSEVKQNECWTGYEVDKGRYITFSPDQMKGFESGADDKTITILCFMPADDLDSTLIEGVSFFAPENLTMSARPFNVMRAAMLQSPRMAAIGKLAIGGRERLVAIAPAEKGMLLYTLRFASQLRDAGQVDRYEGLDDIEVAKDSVKKFRQFINNETDGDFDMASVRNVRVEAIKEAIQAQLDGKETQAKGTKINAPAVVDFMAALDASLKAKKPAKKVGGAKKALTKKSKVA